MILVSSTNGSVGMSAGMDILRAGGSALDAIEAATRLVEDNPADHTVGFNGYPNILGDLELDASLMDGRTLESGAVAAVRGYRNPITLARRVMQNLPHVLLVGAGAERFAAEMGFAHEGDLLTDEVRQQWHNHLANTLPAATVANLPQQTNLWELVQLATDPERTRSTVNFIAQDAAGNIATAVSTSGWAWKYPGRVGDSPIIGAGNYADNRYGAAACTGMGEMAIRASTAHSVVFYMKMGQNVATAAANAMRDLNDLGGRYLSVMNLIALSATGEPAGFTSQQGKTYIYQTADMPTYHEAERTYVPIEQRWK